MSWVVPRAPSQPNRGPSMWKLAIAMTVLTTLAILLRFWARLLHPSRRLWWDDWLALLAWGCCICNVAFAYSAVDLGLGHSQTSIPATNLSKILKVFYVAEILFVVALVFTKASALFYYRRIFTRRPRLLKVAFWVTAAMVVAWCGYTVIHNILVCIPPKKFWLPDTPGYCINSYTSFGMLSVALVLDVGSDLAILILPMPIILHLQIKKGRKAFLIAALFCGYLACVTSIGRMVSYIQTKSFLQSPDFLWYDIPNLEWSFAEMSISLISICFPCWFYLFRRVSQHGWSALFSSRDPASPVRSEVKGLARSGFSPETNSGPWQSRSHSASVERSTSTVPGLAIPSNCIIKEQTFGVSLHDMELCNSRTQ